MPKPRHHHRLLLSILLTLALPTSTLNVPARQKDRTFFKFHSRPDIDAPTWTVQIHEEAAVDPGYWFVAPYSDLDQPRPGAGWVGPHIYDSHGDLVWSGAGMFQHWNVFDFDVTTIKGRQMMTVLYPHGRAGLILDEKYEVWKEVGLESVHADMHAFRVIDGGSRALVITADHVRVGGEEAAMVGFYDRAGCAVGHVGFAELDVNLPGRPVFEWSSRHRVGLDEVTFNDDRVKEECAHHWDILHANSIDKFADNDYLISARHTDTVYKVSHKDGSIVWRLGGVESDFDFIGRGNPIFSRQHHAQVIGQDRTHTIISLFDNAIGTGPNEYKTNSMARGLILLLNTVDWTASILSEYRHPRGSTVNSRGSFQILESGNAFLGWTYSSRISEHAPNGTVVMEAVMNTETHSYRAFKHPWIGRPTQPPDVVSEAVSTNLGDTHTIVHVSWNGATEVATWVLRQAHESGVVENTTLAIFDRTGFETEIAHEGLARYVVAEALDAKWNSLGRSKIVRTTLLDEQGTFPLTHSLVDTLRRSKGLAVPLYSRNPVHAFFCGFGACAAAVLCLLWCARRRPLLPALAAPRRVSKYDLIMREHLRSL